MIKSKIISIYSNVKGLGKTKYTINLAACLKELTHTNVLLVDVSCCILKNMEKGRIIHHDIGVDVFMPLGPLGDTEILSFKDTYEYIIIDLPLEIDNFIEDILFKSSSIHFFVDTMIDTLEKAYQFLHSLHEGRLKELSSKIKIIAYRLDIFDKLSIGEVSGILKENIYAVLPEPGIVDVIVDSKGVPIVLKTKESTYSRMVYHIAKAESDKLLGIALGGGAAFGLAHIGVLKILEREKIDLDMLSGSSMGAVIAAMWGLGFSSNQIEHFADRLSSKVNMIRLLDFTLPLTGLLAGKRLRRFLRDIFEEKTFEDLKIPVKIIVYDLANRETLEIEEGLLVDAVFKSVAVPGIFKPVVEKDRVIVDGGISEPVPIKVLIKKGIKKIISVNVLPGPQDILERNQMIRKLFQQEEDIMKYGSFFRKIGVFLKRLARHIFSPNIFDVIMSMMQAMEYVMAENDCRVVDVCLHPVLSEATSIDFHLAKRFIKRGEEETLAHISDIKALASR